MEDEHFNFFQFIEVKNGQQVFTWRLVVSVSGEPLMMRLKRHSMFPPVLIRTAFLLVNTMELSFQLICKHHSDSASENLNSSDYITTSMFTSPRIRAFLNQPILHHEGLHVDSSSDNTEISYTVALRNLFRYYSTAFCITFCYAQEGSVLWTKQSAMHKSRSFN